MHERWNAKWQKVSIIIINFTIVQSSDWTLRWHWCCSEILKLSKRWCCQWTSLSSFPHLIVLIVIPALTCLAQKVVSSNECYKCVSSGRVIVVMCNFFVFSACLRESRLVAANSTIKLWNRKKKLVKVNCRCQLERTFFIKRSIKEGVREREEMTVRLNTNCDCSQNVLQNTCTKLEVIVYKRRKCKAKCLTLRHNLTRRQGLEMISFYWRQKNVSIG